MLIWGQVKFKYALSYILCMYPLFAFPHSGV